MKKFFKSEFLKKILRFLISRVFLLNIAGAIVFFVLAFILLNTYLKSFTNHGEHRTIPNLIGMPAEEAIDLILENDFRYEIVDTVFDNKHDKGAIVEQNPRPESLVKDGRKVYLIVNSRQDELISMPQLVGSTLRQVNSVLSSYGLEVGSLRYVPDIAVNVIIRQLFNGEEIDAGTKIKKGSQIDLIVGLGISDKTTTVPSLIGLSYKDASNRLLDLFLNTGAVNYDKSVKTKRDSTKAQVYRQSPYHSTINEVNLGYNVDIWLSIDESIIKASQNSAEEDEDSDNDND